MPNSSIRHRRSSPCWSATMLGGGSMRTANTIWFHRPSGTDGTTNVRTRVPSSRAARVMAARQAATGTVSSSTRLLVTPRRRNSAISRIIGRPPGDATV